MFACYDIPQPTKDEENRFWNFVCKLDSKSCWLWFGGYSSNCYPTFNMRNKTYLSSRIAYKINNPIDLTDLLVCHSCDNPNCCNYNHLFTGTNKENKNDSIIKKRHNFGINNGNNKLNNEQIKTLRYLYSIDYPIKDLVKMFGINRRTICKIATSVTWKHVT